MIGLAGDVRVGNEFIVFPSLAVVAQDFATGYFLATNPSATLRTGSTNWHENGRRISGIRG
jgi:hypothetical protein